jgi:hypothetical protein
VLLAVVLGTCVGVMAAPPRVVQTTPENDAVDVDPATSEIVVVFDQPMDPAGRSIVGGGETFPEIIDAPQWRDERTIVIPVRLQADHDYWLSINNENFRNFANRRGESAEPYPLSFSTSPPPGTAPIDPEVNRRAVAQLREAIENNYSYRDLRQVKWDELFAEHREKLEQAATAKAFGRDAAAMLSTAGDMHILVRAGTRTFATHRPNAAMNFNLASVSRLVPEFTWHGGVAIGKLPGGITYILIPSWGDAQRASLDHVYAAIAEADASKGIIIDVRPNGGGDELLARQVAGCFIDTPRVYSKNTIREGGQWRGPFDRVVEPNAKQPPFRGKVVVLQGQQCMSSNESFLLMMKSAGATLVGERSYGSSGRPMPFELANGVTVLLPSWRDMRPDGTLLEGEGVAPDVEVKFPPAVFERNDPVLMAGMKALRG